MDDRFIMPSGRHKGEPITRVPVTYLKWMVNAGHSAEEHASKELARRNTVTPNLDISGHAIDSASNRLLELWHHTREIEEGLHAWLVGRAEAALESEAGRSRSGPKVSHDGITFIFGFDGKWPVLKTVMLAKKRRGATVENH